MTGAEQDCNRTGNPDQPVLAQPASSTLDFPITEAMIRDDLSPLDFAGCLMHTPPLLHEAVDSLCVDRKTYVKKLRLNAVPDKLATDGCACNLELGPCRCKLLLPSLGLGTTTYS